LPNEMSSSRAKLSAPPVWTIDPEDFRPELLRGAAAIISAGGVIIYPTETFYGLGGSPSNERTVERIYRIKGRRFDKPLPLIASDIEAVQSAVSAWPEAAEKLAQAFWPGPLTLVLPASSLLPALLHAGTGNVAIRVSPHPATRYLAACAGGVLIATSANRAGEPAPANPRAIPKDLLDQTGGLVDCGSLPGGLPSTIVDVCAGPPRLLRSGRLAWEAVGGVLGGAFSGPIAIKE
jgi:L-threonylcarbamoyladenylate synthase